MVNLSIVSTRRYGETRRTNYTAAQLAAEARHIAKHNYRSDGKARAWRIVVHEASAGGAALIRLEVDFMNRDGEPETVSHVL